MPQFDLNLLIVFDALFDLRSVTKAAQRLHVTQLAVSHALRRLREAAGDPLFVRAGGALQPTPRARAMAAGASEGLARLRAVMAPADFEPASAVRTFTLAAGSYFCALLVPKLVAEARTQAPGITFRIVPVGADLLTQLDEGSVELALGAFDKVPARLTAEVLYREELVWIAGRDNPIGRRRLTSEELLAHPHVVIATRRSYEAGGALIAEGPLESLLPEHPRQQPPDRVGPMPAILYDAVTAAAVVARTDMVALVPRRLALGEKADLSLRILDVEESRRGIDVGFVTHGRTVADAGIAWLRAQLIRLSG